MTAVSEIARGLAWSVWPVVRHAVRPEQPLPTSVPWTTGLRDPVRGAVRLTGRLHREPGAGALVVLVHGLGGSSESPYVLAASRALAARGLAHLRLNLRGADRSGDDYYHAGLIEDLEAALASPEVRAHGRVFVWGFSLGGHVTLRLAALRPEAGLAGVVAVCPPLDLEAGAAAIDDWRRRPLLRYMLAGLVDIYARVAARHGGPVSIGRARAIRSIRTWDDEVIAPRFGFAGASDYYARVGVGARLGGMRVPALVVSGEHDPVIPLETVLPSLRGAAACVEARVVTGGHVGFPAALDLGQPGRLGLSAQVASWIAARR